MKLIMSVMLAMLMYPEFSQQQEMSDQAVILCGRQLAMARVLLCYGSQLVKKNDKYSNTAMEIQDMSNDVEDTWPWLGRRSALMTTRWGRHKRSGLVDECCLKSCTRDEILNYC